MGKPQDTSNYYYYGKLDEARIYNRALSASEVRQLYSWAPGPVAHYTFDEGGGGTASDSSGFNNNGTWTGTGNHWTIGKFGKAGKFNGSDDYVGITGLTATGGNYTFEFWAKPSTIHSSTTDMFIDTETGRLICGRNANNYQFYDGASWKNFGSGIAYGSYIDSWHHYGFVFDSSNTTAYLYIDGMLKGSNNTYSSKNIGGSIALMSRYNNSNYQVKGILDDVRIYNYARTPGQIVEDMNAGHPIGGSPVGSQVGYWKFDEGFGSSAGNSGFGGSTLNGTLTGTTTPTWISDGKFGKALSFNNGYVQTAATTLNTSFSYSVWFKPSSFVDWSAVITNLYHSAPASGLNIIPRNGQLRICYGNGTNSYSNYIVTLPEIKTNTWNHATITYDGTTASLYLNGGLRDSRNITVAQTNRAIRIGVWASSSGSYLFNGLIDEVKIYNTALTSDQVKLDYNQGKALVMGSLGTTSDGKTASSSASAIYCIPGDTTTCLPPIGQWNFDEKGGPSAQDTSGNGKTGTITGATWTNGKVGGALKFDGSNDYVTTTALRTSPTTETLSLWIKPSAKGTIVAECDNTSCSSYVYSKLSINADGTLIGHLWNLSGTLSFGKITFGQWYYVAMTYDGSILKGYLNGNLMGSKTGSRTPPGTLYQLFGRGNGQCTGGFDSCTVYYSGIIDQVRYSNYARTAAQIAYDYNRGAPVAWFKMDECQGATINNAIASPSGNLITGTINLSTTGSQTETIGKGTCTTNASTPWYNGRNGKYNSSLNFDGTNDYVSLSAFTSPTSLNDWTISSWIYLSAQNPGNRSYVIDMRGNGSVSPNSIGLFIDGTSELNVFQHYSSAGGDYSEYAGNAPSTLVGRWIHFVGQREGTTMKIYINGVSLPLSLISGKATQANAMDLTNGKRIGTYAAATSGDYFFNGQIDDVRIYNYSLTPLQVKTVFNQGASVRFGPAEGNP